MAVPDPRWTAKEGVRRDPGGGARGAGVVLFCPSAGEVGEAKWKSLLIKSDGDRGKRALVRLRDAHGVFTRFSELIAWQSGSPGAKAARGVSRSLAKSLSHQSRGHYKSRDCVSRRRGRAGISIDSAVDVGSWGTSERAIFISGTGLHPGLGPGIKGVQNSFSRVRSSAKPYLKKFLRAFLVSTIMRAGNSTN